MRFVYSALAATIISSGLLFFPISAQAQKTGAVLAVYEVVSAKSQNEGSNVVRDRLNDYVSDIVTANLKSCFVFSFDVLQDNAALSVYREALINYPSNLTNGILLDITPGLLRAAGVKPITDELTNLSDTREITSYQPDDRKKLIDTLATTFQSRLGLYPEIVSGSLIDSVSAEYLKRKYGIKYQEIGAEHEILTTIDGGPPHYPYPSSGKWLLIPDYSASDPIWVIQKNTLDPLYDYGETQKREVDLEMRLLDNAINSQPPGQYGFANLHFSSDDKPDRQRVLLKYIVKNKYDTISPQSLPKLYTLKTSVYTRTLKNNTAWWISTPKYRLRLIADEKKVKITDIRIYDNKLTDPYTDRAAMSGRHWIAPFLIDGSKWYKNNDEGTFHSPKNDFNRDQTSLLLRDRELDDSTRTETASISGSILIRYFAKEMKEILLVFGEDDIQMVGFDPTERKLPYQEYTHHNFPVQEKRDSIAWKIGDKAIYAMFFDCKSSRCDITFQTDNIADFNSDRYITYPYTFPEPIHREIDIQNSEIPRQINLLKDKKENILIKLKDKYGLPVLTRIAITQPDKNKNGAIDTRVSYLHDWEQTISVDLNSHTISSKRYLMLYNTGRPSPGSLVIYINTNKNCRLDKLLCLDQPKLLLASIFPFFSTNLLPH